jgi:hypothetical protein
MGMVTFSIGCSPERLSDHANISRWLAEPSQFARIHAICQQRPTGRGQNTVAVSLVGTQHEVCNYLSLVNKGSRHLSSIVGRSITLIPYPWNSQVSEEWQALAAHCVRVTREQSDYRVSIFFDINSEFDERAEILVRTLSACAFWAKRFTGELKLKSTTPIKSDTWDAIVRLHQMGIAAPRRQQHLSDHLTD